MSTPETTLYGIANCDTVKKSRAWLTAHGIDHHFHDFKKHGVPTDRLHEWMAAAGWEKLVNRRGTTWRKLGPEAQASVHDTASATALLQAHPSAIKRPVVEWQRGNTHQITIGFDAEQWEQQCKRGAAS